MIMAGTVGGSALPLFKDILRISNNINTLKTTGFDLWAIAICLKMIPFS
jgi:hypothetical protein